MTPIQILWFLGIIIGTIVIGGLVALTFYIFSLRSYIVIVRPGKRDFHHRTFFFPKDNILIYKKGLYFFNDKCIGSINNKTAIRINPDYPTALEWKDQDKDISNTWNFLSIKAIMETMNSKHAETVAMAGKQQMQLMDMILIVMVAICIFFLMIIAYKTFTPSPVQCILNATGV